MSLKKIATKQNEIAQRLDDIAKHSGLHSLLVMESTPTHMVVFAANEQPIYSVDDAGGKSNQEGCHELYCERVVDTKEALLVADAKLDKEWMNNEDLVRFGLGVYYGVPIIEHGEAVGTVCALNDKAFDFTEGQPSVKELIGQLKHDIEAMLA
ncbi:GAF domain-containing protein [Marinomonas sp.]|uniref:GAF domain-containing protein n=1 Tax=Marinomonas sp. TaxID=1904862 RepID=UPI003BAD57FA